MNSPKRLLVTGAAGSIGKTVCSAWEKNSNYTLTCCDILKNKDVSYPIEFADFGDYDRMRQLCLDQDVLLHLAYIPQKNLGKQEHETSDIAANIALFEAARESGVNASCLQVQTMSRV